MHSHVFESMPGVRAAEGLRLSAVLTTNLDECRVRPSESAAGAGSSEWVTTVKRQSGGSSFATSRAVVPGSEAMVESGSI